jgi:hypothetical protein
MRLMVLFVLAALVALTLMGALVQAPARQARVDGVRLAELDSVRTRGQ